MNCLHVLLTTCTLIDTIPSTIEFACDGMIKLPFEIKFHDSSSKLVIRSTPSEITTIPKRTDAPARVRYPKT